MEYAVIVGGRQARAQLACDLERLPARQPPDAAQQRDEVLAVDEFHRQEGAAVRFADVVDRSDRLRRRVARTRGTVTSARV